MFFFILQSLFWFLLFLFAGFWLGKWLKKLLCKNKHKQETNTVTTSTRHKDKDQSQDRDDLDQTVYMKTTASQPTSRTPASDAYNAMLKKAETSNKSKLATGAATATLATAAYKAYATQKPEQAEPAPRQKTKTNTTTNKDEDTKIELNQPEKKPTQPQSLLNDEYEKIVPRDEESPLLHTKMPATEVNDVTDRETINITSDETQVDKKIIVETIDAEREKADQALSTKLDSNTTHVSDIEIETVSITSDETQADKTTVVEAAEVALDKATQPQTLLGEHSDKIALSKEEDSTILHSSTRALAPEMEIAEPKDKTTDQTPATSLDQSSHEPSSNTPSQDQASATHQPQINDKADIAAIDVDTDKTNRDSTTNTHGDSTATTDSPHQTTATTKALGAAAITGAAGILAATTKKAKDVASNLSQTEDTIAKTTTKHEIPQEQEKPEPLDTSNFDPLQVVEGIGNTMEQLLYTNGIGTWKKLSLQSNNDLRALLDQEGDKHKGVQTEGWIEQAKLAASGQFTDLVNLQKIDGQSKVERRFSYLLHKENTIPHDKDDLKRVIGIEPKVMELLNNAGIYTFKELSHTSIEHLQKILDDGGQNFNITDPETWPEQAKLADQQEWEKLSQYKGHLN